MGTVHTRSYQLGFSLNKQSDILTEVPDAGVKYMRSVRTFAPIREEEPAKVSDRTWFGKGHPFPTFSDRIQKKYVIPATERSATSLELLMAIAFVMGDVATTGPGTGNEAATYRHTITWQDLAANKQVLYTSLVEKMGTEYQKKLSGAYISSVTITGNRNDHVVMSYEGAGRLYEDSVISMPTMSAAAFYKTLYGTAKFGPSASLATISAEVLSFNLTLNQNPQDYFLMGNAAGEEMLLTEVLIGDQTASGQVVIRVSAAHRAHFLAQDRVGFELVLKSPDLTEAGGPQHQCKITLPNCILNNEVFGEDGQTVSYTLAFNEEAVLKYGSDEPVTVEFTTDIDDTELVTVLP